MDFANGMLGLLGLYSLLLIVGGLVCFVREASQEINYPTIAPLPTWNIRILEFILFLSGTTFFVIVSSSLVSEVTADWEANPMLAQWRVPALGLTFQLSILLAIVLCLQPNTRLLNIQFSPVKLRPGEALKKALPNFLLSIPLLFVFASGWEQMLKLTSELIWPISLHRQELLEMFQFDQGPAIAIVMILMAVVFAPLSEELLFRGILYRYFKGRSSAFISMVATSILFAAIHGNVVSFLPLFLLGMLLCRSYEKEQNILVPIFFHALFNANTIGILLLTQASGQPIDSL